MSPMQAKEDGATRLIDVIERAENASLEAVRNFLDTVDGVFPIWAAMMDPVARSSTRPSR